MGQPHKWAEIIKEKADGKDIQYMDPPDDNWYDMAETDWDFDAEGMLFRIKPEAPKWPTTSLTDKQLDAIWDQSDPFNTGASAILSAHRRVADAAVAQLCEVGTLVPAERYARAERALLRAGFVDHGAQEWKPPVNEAAVKLRHAEEMLIQYGFSYSPDEGWSRPLDAVPIYMLEKVVQETMRRCGGFHLAPASLSAIIASVLKKEQGHGQ
jgi:hypothetical protein